MHQHFTAEPTVSIVSAFRCISHCIRWDIASITRLQMSLIRKINLVEVLKEELEAAGADLRADLTDEQLEAWSEEQIRAYYCTPGQAATATAALHTAPAVMATVATAPAPIATQELDIAQQMAGLQRKFPAMPNPAAMKTWFPGLALSKTETAHPKAVVLCFHSSGNAEDMFTSEGTGSRRQPSPLLEACRAHGWKLLAAQLPGRGLRIQEPPVPNLQAVAKQLLPVVAPTLLAAGGRYALVGHSMGCWAAYELLLLLLQEGFPEPAVACFSAMPWPHIPLQQRPWRQQKMLGEAAFKDECRGWDINEVVFSEGMWDVYQPMLRADFKLFDEYKPSSSSSSSPSKSIKHNSNSSANAAGTANGSSNGSACNAYGSTSTAQPAFNFPMQLFYGRQDRRVKPDMVLAWSGYTRKACKLSCIEGNHLFPLQPAAKTQWLEQVAAVLTMTMAD